MCSSTHGARVGSKGHPARRDMARRFQLDGAEAVGSTPKEFAAFLKAAMQKWSKVIRDAGIKPEQ